MTVPVVRQRARAPKTKTGCRTCRLRRVKCDEGRPQCRKCTSSGRECGGYEVPSPVGVGSTHRRLLLPRDETLSPDQIIVRAPSNLPIKLTSEEDYAIQFFKSQSLYQVPGYTSTTSWEKLVMQVSHTEPAMMHAAVAVGFLHRARAFKPKNALVAASDWADSEFALRHFSQALAQINKYIQGITSNKSTARVEVVLLASLMFSCFETIRGFDESSDRHRRAGLRVLQECLNSSDGMQTIELKKAPQSSMDVLVEAFMRIDCDSTMVGEFEPRLSVSCDPSWSSVREFMPMSFTSLEDARMHLDALTNAVYRTRGRLVRLAEAELAASMDTTYMDEDWYHTRVQAASRIVDISAHPDLAIELELMENATLAWSSAFDCIKMSTQDIRYQAWLLFQIQYFLIWIQAMTWRDATESLVDRLSDRFPHALDLIQQFSRQMFLNKPHGCERRTFWLGGFILMPLFFVAIKCRDSRVRRDTIDLMRKLNLQEGLWDSDVLAMYTKRIVDLEEERARASNGFAPDQVLTSGDVPEEVRFCDITISAQLEHLKMGKLVFAKYAGSGLTFEEDRFVMFEEERAVQVTRTIP